MNNSFYIPLQSMNLAHYLGSGIIAPAMYIENKNADIQDRFKNYLLLSSSKFTKETNCALEVVLNTDEEAPKKISENFYLFDMPLPISRIKGIYFTNEEQKVSTDFNITSGAAFIPNELLKVSIEESIDTNELENIEYKTSDKNWNDELKKYDQILGGFSAMKISKEHFQNYPTDYFPTLGNINNLFNNILEQQHLKPENNYRFAFTSEGKFKDFHDTIYSEIGYNEVNRYAEKDNVSLEIKNGIVQLDKIPENTQTYLIAILDSYGKGKRKQIDSFISDLISGKFNDKRKEGLSLIFGLNKGYKAFRNKYKTSNFEIDIKFHLDSKLDYYIIESIYQNVFNSLNNIPSFKYIDNWVAPNPLREIKNSNYVTFQMIDKTIVWKPVVLTLVEKFLAKIVQKIRSWFPSFIEIKNEIESEFKEDIELLKRSIEAEVEDKFKAKLERNRIEIETLTKKVNQLEKERSETKVKKEENITEPKTDITSTKPETTKSDANENINGKLFETPIPANKLRKAQLDKKNMSALKELAEEYKIPKISSFKKSDLIAEIIKYEAEQ